MIWLLLVVSYFQSLVVSSGGDAKRCRIGSDCKWDIRYNSYQLLSKYKILNGFTHRQIDKMQRLLDANDMKPSAPSIKGTVKELEAGGHPLLRDRPDELIKVHLEVNRKGGNVRHMFHLFNVKTDDRKKQ